MRWLKRIVIGFFAIIGFLVVAVAALGIYLGPKLIAPAERAVPESAVLQLDLTKPLLPAGASDSLASFFAPEQLTLREIEEALDRAGRDSRVKGVVVRLGEPLRLATSQELRDSIAAFRKRGKFAIAFAESYGAPGSGSGDYYLATACDEIWLQPSGELGLVGIEAETPFLKGTFDKIGVVPRFDKRQEYKTAVDQLTDTAYSPPFRESMQSILGSLYGQLVKGVSDGRGMSADAVKAAIDRGPFLASEALKEKLVDRLGYRDEADDAAKRRAGGEADLISIADYLRAGGRETPSGRTIAVINGNGPIVSGESDPDSPLGVGQIGADTIVAGFNEAMRSRDVAAIVFRIDSPGGSSVASDTIWRAVTRAEAAGKPVIVSMGNVAASGGYFISAPATKIVAEPGTLTGSIGVFGGKFIVKDLLDKLGVTVDSLQFGTNADMWSADRDFSPQGWQRLEASLDAVYRDFTSKVADGRHIEPSRIPDIAKGRVFTGEQAQRLGLVDSLGGFPTALALAKDAAKIGPQEAVQMQTFPRPKREFRALLRYLEGKAMGQETLAAKLTRISGSVEALRSLIEELPALAGNGDSYLLMPPVEIRH